MIRSSARRDFLRGVGLGAVALPFVRSAQAQPGLPAKRLIVFASPNGTVMRDFYPATPDGAYPAILKPLEPYRAKLNVMRGLDMVSAAKSPVPKDHLPDNANMLTGRQASVDGAIGGISVDQHIANVVGRQTKFASLALGARPGYAISARGVGQRVSPETNPQKAFDRMFKDVAADPADLARIKAERKSMLDVLNAELKDARCALGIDERPKFDAHVESLRDLEKSLDIQVSAGCKAPALGAAAVADVSGTPALLKQHMDLAVAAVTCDLSRVITIQFGSIASYKWLNIEGTHHGISHGSEGVTAPQAQREMWLTQIETWIAEQFAYLVGRLAAIPDGPGTMLDRCAVLWGHEQSNGGTHQRRDMPWIMAGGCGGSFKTGRVINFMGKSHSGFLISLANAMGVPTTEFGEPELSKGPLADL